MPFWKSLLLHGYYHASRPYRWWSNLNAAFEHQMPVVVLFYHRIADDRAGAWTTSNRTFARQIRWLSDHFDVVSLGEAQRRIRSGDSARPCVSITFDDGYAENCRQAIPLLVRHGIRCTYFVTLENLLTGEPFAHDLAQGNRFPPNNAEQLKAMAAAGIEIGAHSYSHANLGRITDEEVLYREIVTAGCRLAEIVQRPVRYFAFPFGQRGDLSRRAFALAREAGYEAVCSAYGGYNFPGDDAFHLQRIHVDDDLIRLKNRATIDPRKAGTCRFPYEIVDRERRKSGQSPF